MAFLAIFTDFFFRAIFKVPTLRGGMVPIKHFF